MTFPQGIDFRGSSGYVTDPTNCIYEIFDPASGGTPQFPRITPQGNNVGWEFGNTVHSTRDRNAGGDARLAGTHGANNDYRFDLPSAGNYNVYIAAGEATYSASTSVTLKDDTTTLSVLCSGSTGAGNSFRDAANNVRTAANWVATSANGGTAYAATFATTIARFSLAGAIAHIYIEAAGGGGVTGTLAYTNANDTSAASGTTTITGTLARTNANDTSAASGTTKILGTLATTNANDTVVASGAVGGGSTGTVAYTNANDTVVAAGTTTVVGTLAKTNANDSVAASGWAGVIAGTLAYTNNNDTVVASGTTPGPVSSNNGAGGSASRSFGRAFPVDPVKPLQEELRKWKKLRDRELGIEPKDEAPVIEKEVTFTAAKVDESIAPTMARLIAGYDAVASEFEQVARQKTESLAMRQTEDEFITLLITQEL